MSDARKVTVVGGGPWGVALAAGAAHAGSDVVLLTRRDPSPLPERVKIVRSVRDAMKHARLIVIAIPSGVARPALRDFGDHLDGSHYLVHGIRGLEGPELLTICDVMREETPARRVGALGGPALADDLLAGRPSVLVCGSRYPEVREAVAAAFTGDRLRVYPTSDLRGLEWASALVGCLTIAVGYARALETSPALVAALISRSIGEAARIASAAGGEERTVLGLAGYGDLLASISQEQRPEVVLGTALAHGKTRAEALEAAKLRVEGVDLIPRIVKWAEEHRVRAPIFRALGSGVIEGRDARAILHELMTLPVEEGA